MDHLEDGQVPSHEHLTRGTWREIWCMDSQRDSYQDVYDISLVIEEQLESSYHVIYSIVLKILTISLGIWSRAGSIGLPYICLSQWSLRWTVVGKLLAGPCDLTVSKASSVHWLPISSFSCWGFCLHSQSSTLCGQWSQIPITQENQNSRGLWFIIQIYISKFSTHKIFAQ